MKGESVIRRVGCCVFTRMRLPSPAAHDLRHEVDRPALGRSPAGAVMTVWLGLEAMAVTASPVRRGSTYVGTGRDPVGSLVVQFFVSPDRRSVMHLEVWDLPVACKGLRSTDLPSYLVVDSARIQRDGTFRTNFGIPGRITLTGRFLGHGRASGTVRYRVRGPDKGCTADGIWTAHVSPPGRRCSTSPGPPAKEPA